MVGARCKSCVALEHKLRGSQFFAKMMNERKRGTKEIGAMGQARSLTLCLFLAMKRRMVRLVHAFG